MRAEGKRSKEIAKIAGVSAPYVSQLAAKYFAGGIEAIAGNHYGGNLRNMSVEEESKKTHKDSTVRLMFQDEAISDESTSQSTAGAKKGYVRPFHTTTLESTDMFMVQLNRLPEKVVF